MTRLTHCLFILFLFTSCKNKKYTFELTSAEIKNGVLSTEKTIENDIIEASNDSSAYRQAYSLFRIHWKVYKRFENTTNYKLPISFKIRNSDGFDVTHRLADKKRIAIQESVLSEFLDTAQSLSSKKIDSVDEKKAYGPVFFGITKKEYKRLKNWDYLQSIGNGRYLITPIYNDNDSLYMLQLEGITKTANFYETEVKEGFDNLVSIIESKYKAADDVRGYPSFLSMKPGYIQWSSTWNLGDKIIKIGVGETESQYYPVCWIYSSKMKAQNDQSDLKKEETNVKSDGAKF